MKLHVEPNGDYQLAATESSSTHVLPNAFIATVIGSEKETGSTRSTISLETSRKFCLFSSRIGALRAPFSIATCNGSARNRIGLVFPWMVRSAARVMIFEYNREIRAQINAGRGGTVERR